MAKGEAQNKGGRPTKLTPETSRKILEYVSSGNYPEIAAAAAGVAKRTLAGWLRAGAEIRARVGDAGIDRLSKHRRDLARFSLELEQALAQAEARDVMVVGMAASGRSATIDPKTGKQVAPAVLTDWRAAAWLLERRNKPRWSQKIEGEVTGAIVTTDAGPATQSAREWVMAKLKRLQEVAEQQERERAAGITTEPK